MTPIDWAIRPLLNYANWTGRATRAEFWWFTLFSTILGIVFRIIDAVIGIPFIGNMGFVTLVGSLFLFIPSVMVTIRRLHDVDRSGLWIFIVLVPLIGAFWLLYYYVSGGTSGTNRFGDDPYYDPYRQHRYA